MPGSAPPLLAQHDWVHIVADYGTKVESEPEVFAFIARANDDPKGFSLLAMVVSLFETGYLEEGAGLFEAFPGQLSLDGVAVRVADAMRRGALVSAASISWLLTGSRSPICPPMRPAGGSASSRSPSWPWMQAQSARGSRGGISEFQWNAGHELAATEGRPHDSFGASVVPG
jgi:hypothetical protein